MSATPGKLLNKNLYIGTAAWTVPKDFSDLFPLDGSHLQRYSSILNAVEINTSFYKDHKAKTYERWAETVPDYFRFSVKFPKLVTHEHRLYVIGPKIFEFFDGVLHLGEKLGMILVQIPPSLVFDQATAEKFFSTVRSIYKGPISFEPRHRTWNAKTSLKVLNRYSITRVWADPDPLNVSSEFYESIVSDSTYYRLHGSPEIYRSNYDEDFLKQIQNRINLSLSENKNVWCIFDNTTFGFATLNAVQLKNYFSRPSLKSRSTQEARL